MKKTLLGSVLLTSFVSVSVLFAGEYEQPSYGIVQEVHDLDFSVERDGKSLDFSWDAYDESDFKWYKIVYSKTNMSPSYPEDTVIRYVPRQESESLGLSSYTALHGGYYRLCVITQSNDRKCSNVVFLEGLEKDAETVHKKTHHKKTHKKKSSQSYARVDQATQKKVDMVMGAFFAKVEQKYSGNDRVKVLREVGNKLSSIEQKKPELAPVVQFINERIAKKIKEYGVDINDVTKILQDI